jgi:hypothetical protein
MIFRAFQALLGLHQKHADKVGLGTEGGGKTRLATYMNGTLGTAPSKNMMREEDIWESMIPTMEPH